MKVIYMLKTLMMFTREIYTSKGKEKEIKEWLIKKEVLFR